MSIPTTTAFYQRRFEHDRVKMLLAVFDFSAEELKAHTADIRQTGRGLGDDGYLSFRALHATDRFASCPVRLGAHPVSGTNIDRLTLPYFLKFGTSYLWHVYHARWWDGGRRDDRPFGLVLGMPNIRGGVIVHDADLPGAGGRTFLVHRSPNPDEPPAVTLEPYTAFLRRLLKHWRGGKPVPTVPPSERVRPRLERWMVERLGSGPALVVYAWLHGCWDDPLKRHVTMRNGVASLCLTQSIIARHTALGADSVKHALATLRREGLITTRRGDRRTYLAVAGEDGGWLGDGIATESPAVHSR